MTTYRIVFTGRPITKKNHGRILMAGGRRIFTPSKQYKAYEDACGWQLKSQWNGRPVEEAVSVMAKYYLPNRKSWPDLLGLEQATADILQHWGVLGDDGYIQDWDGSCIEGIDPEGPRVEIMIKECGKGEGLNALHPKLAKMPKGAKRK
nr:MAG TPA: Endodeoxyribonuclease RusA [Caudoviricetes sp.]